MSACWAAGEGRGDKGYLDHLCRRGYICIAPEHFVSNFREPEDGPYETAEFHQRHPEWTAVGKFTFEHSIAGKTQATPLRVRSASVGGHKPASVVPQWTSCCRWTRWTRRSSV